LAALLTLTPWSLLFLVIFGTTTAPWATLALTVAASWLSTDELGLAALFLPRLDLLFVPVDAVARFAASPRTWVYLVAHCGFIAALAGVLAERRRLFTTN
jgi:hypothetical protein